MKKRKLMSIMLSMLFVLVIAGMTVGSFHVGSKLFAASETVSIEQANEAGLITQPSEPGYFDWLFKILKDTVVDIVKQAFAYIHQTIILAILFWIFGIIKKKWKQLQPAVNTGIDHYMSKSTLENRNAIKKYLNELVTMSLDTVEAAFIMQKAPLTGDQKEEAAYREQRSKEKAAAALYLVFKELTMDKLDRVVGKEKTVEELVGDLLKDIEVKLLEKRSLFGTTSQSTDAGFVGNSIWNTTAATSVREQELFLESLQPYSTMANKQIETAKATLPTGYIECIHKTVNAK